MKTQINNAKWFLKMVAAAGLALSAVRPAMAHGGGGMGGGMGASMSHSSSSSFARSSGSSLSNFNSNNFATKMLSTTQHQPNKLTGTNLNTLNYTSKLPISGKSTFPTTNDTSKFPTPRSQTLNGSTVKNLNVNKIVTPVNNKIPGSASLIDKFGANKIAQLNPNNVTVPPGGFTTGPLLGGNVPTKGCWPNYGFGYPGFGLYGLGLWPYFGGYGGYGGYGGGSYGGGTTYAGGTTVSSDSTAPAAAMPASTVAANVPNTTQGIDLQLVDVRLLDNGDASQQIGPRYRVTFRNVGTSPVDHDFNVALVAADDANLTTNLPTIESRISSVGTGGVKTVDLRLPATAFDMGQDSHSEFGKLLVFVDSHGEVNDVNRDNNAASVDRTAVQPAA